MVMSGLVSEINRMHAHVCQALADPKRILILYALHERPRNVTELTELYEFTQPTVSRHLRFLRERDLVLAERSGNTITYSLADPRVIDALDIMRSVMADILARNAELAERLDD
jgi:DNA-binding transcriptional ArsR family regulator